MCKLAEYIVNDSTCEYQWVDWFSDGDMLDMLLRVEALCRREESESPAIMHEILMIVEMLMTPRMLRAYMTVEGEENNGEELIVGAWRAMLERFEGARVGKPSRKLYELMRKVKAHDRKYHDSHGIRCSCPLRQGISQSVVGGGMAAKGYNWEMNGLDSRPPGNRRERTLVTKEKDYEEKYVKAVHERDENNLWK